MRQISSPLSTDILTLMRNERIFSCHAEILYKQIYLIDTLYTVFISLYGTKEKMTNLQRLTALYFNVIEISKSF